MSRIPPRPADEPLFGAWARQVAAEHGCDSAFAALVHNDDAETAGLRAALEQGFEHAGASRDVLAKALAHERWGQHAGARGHLLALAMFARRGLELVCEPELGGRAPDLLISRGQRRALVEVRAMTGCGLQPWEQGAVPPSSRGARPVHGRLSERDRRRRARAAAVERAKARAALKRDLARAVAQAVTHKLEVYGELVARAHLPFVVALYEDTDNQLAQLVARWGLGDARDHSATPPRGAWTRDTSGHADLSAVLVFGRDAAPNGELRFHTGLTLNPAARQELPVELIRDMDCAPGE